MSRHIYSSDRHIAYPHLKGLGAALIGLWALRCKGTYHEKGFAVAVGWGKATLSIAWPGWVQSHIPMAQLHYEQHLICFIGSIVLNRARSIRPSRQPSLAHSELIPRGSCLSNPALNERRTKVLGRCSKRIHASIVNLWNNGSRKYDCFIK